MSFDRHGEIRVSLPFFVPYSLGIQFVKSKSDWIKKHRPAENQPLANGARIGKAHRLYFEPVSGPKVTTRVKNTLIVIQHPLNMSASEPDVQAAATKAAQRALKKEADRLLPQRLEHLAREHGFSYKSVRTKRLTSRWGSCSHEKEIILNTYLMQVPWELIDYVILHELVHTEHLNHSSAFWARFHEVLPDAKKRRKTLKSYRTAIITE